MIPGFTVPPSWVLVALLSAAVVVLGFGAKASFELGERVGAARATQQRDAEVAEYQRRVRPVVREEEKRQRAAAPRVRRLVQEVERADERARVTIEKATQDESTYSAVRRPPGVAAERLRAIERARAAGG
jgi:hypothetical protein